MAPGGSTVFAVAGFMTCSSMMLVINKLAVHVLPYPMTVLALQLCSCAIGVRFVGLLGFIQMEGLRLEKVLQFGITPIAFLATLFANIKILQYTNVETFIMIRNATPLATSVLDWIFMGRMLPDSHSVLMLVFSLGGAAGYVSADNGFDMRAYSWAIGWLLIFLFDQIYIKHIISTVQMGNWDRVYYNNAISGFFALIYACVYENALARVHDGWVGDLPFGIAIVVVSCAMGTAMSYFAFLARDALSATSFTVVGNVCKVLSVLVNFFIWDKHASSTGLGWLALVIVGAGMYKQAPLRSQASDEKTKLLGDEKTKLLVKT